MNDNSNKELKQEQLHKIKLIEQELEEFILNKMDKLKDDIEEKNFYVAVSLIFSKMSAFYASHMYKFEGFLEQSYKENLEYTKILLKKLRDGR